MDILEYIKKMQEMYGEDVITTADKLERPPKALEQQMFQDFDIRNPRADGGQLVAPSVDGLRPGYRGDIEKTKTLNLIKNKMEPLNKGEKLKLYRSYDDLFKQEYKRLVSLGDPFSKTDLNRAVINRIASKNPTINLAEGIGLDKIPGGGNEESKTLFERYDKTSARGPLFNKKELKNFTQGNAVKATGYTKTQEKIFNAILNGNSDKSSLAKKLKISEGRLDYNIEKLMRNLSKGSGDQYVFLKNFKEKDLEKVRNSIFESPSLEQSYQRTIVQSVLQSTKLGSPERKKAFQKLKEFNKFKQVMVENGLDPKLLSMDHAASYRAIKNGNIKSFLSVTPVIKDINTLKSSFDKRSQLNLRRMKDYLLAGDTKKYKYFLKNQTELENLWKTMTGGQSSLGKIRVVATGPTKGAIKIYDYGATSLLDKNKNLLDELANNLSIRKNIVNASTTKNLDEARRIMLEGSELTEKQMLGTMKKTDRAAKTVIDKSFQALDRPEMFKAEKKISQLLVKSGFYCTKANGGVCSNPRAYTKSIMETMELAKRGDNAAVAKINKMGKFMKGFKGAAKFSGWALLAEVGFAAPLAAVDYAKGANKDEIISNITYGLAGKSIDEQLKEKYAGYGQAQKLFDLYDKAQKAEELTREQGGYRSLFTNLQREKDAYKAAEKAMDPFMIPTPHLEEGRYFDENKVFTDLARDKSRLSDYMTEREKIGQERMKKMEPAQFYIGAKYGGLIGDKSGPAPESGPMSRGLRSLYNNGRKL